MRFPKCPTPSDLVLSVREIHRQGRRRGAARRCPCRTFVITPLMPVAVGRISIERVRMALRRGQILIVVPSHPARPLRRRDGYYSARTRSYRARGIKFRSLNKSPYASRAVWTIRDGRGALKEAREEEGAVTAVRRATKNLGGGRALLVSCVGATFRRSYLPHPRLINDNWYSRTSRNL